MNRSELENPNQSHRIDARLFNESEVWTTPFGLAVLPDVYRTSAEVAFPGGGGALIDVDPAVSAKVGRSSQCPACGPTQPRSFG